MLNARKFLAGVLITAALAFPVAATTIVQMDLDEMVRIAPAVARVRCISNDTRWEGGHIYTFTTFQVLETLKGNLPPQITVRLIGGRVGHLKLHVEGVPRFSPGEEAYLFIEPSQTGELSITSWAQGTFRIHLDTSMREERVTQDLGGMTVFDPATKQFKPGTVRNMPVEQFRRLVSLAVERQRAVK